ncbi:MAG: SoxR reducing system RseC family protein [Candidatus Methylopumilus sp.]
MIQETAIVISIDQDIASLEIVRNKPCGLCGQSRGCGISIWGRLFGHRPNIFKAQNTVNAKVDQIVVIGVEENALLWSSFAVYGIPLALLILGAVLANTLFADALHADRNTALGALFGLFIGYLWLKLHQQGSSLDARYRPVILSLQDPSSIVHVQCEKR